MIYRKNIRALVHFGSFARRMEDLGHKPWETARIIASACRHLHQHADVIKAARCLSGEFRDHLLHGTRYNAHMLVLDLIDLCESLVRASMSGADRQFEEEERERIEDLHQHQTYLQAAREHLARPDESKGDQG